MIKRESADWHFLFLFVIFAKRIVVVMEGELDQNILFRLFYWLNIIVALWIMIKVLLGNRNPIATIAWVFVLLFLPFIGPLLYFFFGHDTRRRRYIRRRFGAQIQKFTQMSHHSYKEYVVPESYRPLATYLEKVADAHTSSGNVELITDTHLFMNSLLSAVNMAKEHIHIQFYIFKDDKCGRRLRDALVAKAKDGVEVRLLYDSVGSWRTSTRFFDAIRSAGGSVESFLRVRFPFLSKKANYRNHRKVVVVDGKIGFLGGCNIANRYLRGLNGGVWRDTMLSVSGYGVYGLQSSFLADWFFASGTMLSDISYFPVPDEAGKIPLQVVMSNPVGQWRPIPTALMMVLNSSRTYIYMQTPYLMPNEQVITAMECAALSGVDVALMIPERSDNRLADYASRSYIERLLKAGVKVYLFSGGMLHAKTVVSDDMLSIIGSANIDFRSFDYNFEISAYVYDKSLATANKKQFIADCEQCRQVQLRDFVRRPIIERVKESLARLFSPIL